MKKILTLFVMVLLISGCGESTHNTSHPEIQPKPPPKLTHVEPIYYSNTQPMALVIGNNQYEYSPLKNTVNDATDMAQALEQIGFKVTLKTNLDQHGMDDAIHKFGDRLSEKQSVGLFYFSGHGAQVDGKNYLLPIDNDRIRAERDLQYYAIHADKVLNVMRDAKTLLNIVVLDACRDNPFHSLKGLQRGLAQVQPGRGSIVAFATAPGATASDTCKNGRNGLFTCYLLEALETAPQKHVRIEDMFMQVSNAVTRESGGQQEPWYNSSLKDKFCFGGCPVEISVFQDRLQDNSKGPKMAWIPAGRFQMGNIQGEGGENELSVNRFAIGTHEVTFAEYDRFAEATGRKKPDDFGWGRGNRPVINVSWEDATAYAQWLTQQTGQTYRLPTEAQWEYAARAGTNTQYWWGNEIGSNRANCEGCGSQWDGKKTAPVGSFAANAFGLFDVVGNVCELTCSEYGGKAQDCLSRANANNRSRLVQRGGSWIDSPTKARSMSRYWKRLSYRFYDCGFRVVRQ
ncbi:MAG: SUMF1/EgtB/PvdO family nonheme iron enzyme [Pseudomonadota bacterium]